MALVFQLAVIMVASKVAGSVSVRLGQPSVLGKLLIGIVLGPAMLGVIHETETLAQVSEIGVILLMFMAGLETDIGEFKRTGKASAFVGLGGIIAPLIFGYITGKVLDLSSAQSWFLGLLLSATSVSISVQALKEMNQLKTREGTTILGAAVIDDVAVIIMLAFLMSLIGESTNFIVVIATKIAFFICAIIIGWKVVPWFMNRFVTLKVSETIVSSALIICFVYAYIAEYAGVAAIIGAYIAGVAISVTEHKQEVFEKVETIGYSIFIPVFFASIGIAAQFDGILENLGRIVILSTLAVMTKLIGASLGAKVANFGWRSALGIGAAMVSRGEVALIIATIGLRSKLLSQDVFAVIVVVVLITTIVTPPMMKLFFREGVREREQLS